MIEYSKKVKPAQEVSPTIITCFSTIATDLDIFACVRRLKIADKKLKGIHKHLHVSPRLFLLVSLSFLTHPLLFLCKNWDGKQNFYEAHMPHAAQIRKNVFGVRREAYVPHDVLTHILLQNFTPIS